MRIAPKGDFNSTENLPGTEHADPRDTEYDESSVEIDLGGCHFIGPSAALWCITYSLLAKMRGSDCVLLIPQHGDVSPYLKSRGVLQFLQNKGVMVDFREVPDPDWGRPIVPMSEFETEYEVEEAVNEADLTLMESGLSTPDIYSTVTNAFAELALNAVQHSESEVGAFGYIQFYKSVRAHDLSARSPTEGLESGVRWSRIRISAPSYLTIGQPLTLPCGSG